MTTPPQTVYSPAQVGAAVRATYVAFIGAGFGFASWASRIPQIRDRLHLNPSELGLVLLAVAVGSLIALPLSGPVCTRLGTRRTVATMSVLMAFGLLVTAGGYLVGVTPVVLGLFVLGLGNGAWDVGMNVQGAYAERHLGRSIMPRFHAGFSVGTVAGALVGAAMVALDVSVAWHLAAVAVLVAATIPFAVRRFLPDHGDTDADDDTSTERPAGSWTGWTEPRTLLIGLLVLAFAFAEGAGNDWISVALIDGYGVPAEIGTLGFAAFLAAMTTGRWFGPGVLDRYGRVPVIRTMIVLAIVGLALFVLGPTTPVAVLGALLWGVGVSLGFPVGMSAGSDEPARAASRVSVIASIGYCAFLAGPPAIGFLGEHVSVLRAVVSVAVLLAVAAAVAGNLRPPDARSGEA